MTQSQRSKPTPSVARGRLALLALFCAALLLMSTAALAGPIGFSASAGTYTEVLEDFFLGAGARLTFAAITVSPNAEYVFVESGSTYTLNVDATLTVLPLGVASGYLGGGLGFVTIDPEDGDSDTETGVNAIVGVGFNAVPLKPFAQLKYVFLEGDDPLALSIGARF